MTHNTASTTANRQERLALVRNSLLRPQERNGPLVRSQSQARLQREPFIKDRGNEYSDTRPNGNWEGMKMNERDRVDIEASGRWEAPVTVTARDSGIESVVSLPKWRDPVTWVRDQMDRNRR